MKYNLSLITFFFLFSTGSFSQNIGISTATPTNKLHILDTGLNSDPIRIETLQLAQLGDTHVLVSNTSGVVRYRTISSITSGLAQDIDSVTLNGNTLTVYITNGTSSSVDLSSLNLSDADWLDINTNNAPTSINNSIYTNGRVGIGTSNPQSTLHVNGQVVIDTLLPAIDTVDDVVFADPTTNKLRKSNSVTFRSSSKTILKNANYTVNTQDEIVIGDASLGDITITLPSAIVAANKVIQIKRIDMSVNNLTINSIGGNIDGLTSKSLVSFQSAQLVSDGANWWILNN